VRVLDGKSMPNWPDLIAQGIIGLIQAVIGGVIVGWVVYQLDERRAIRDRRLSDYRIASNWYYVEPKIKLRCFDLTKANLSSYKFIKANLEETTFEKARMWATNFTEANLRITNFRNSKMVGAKLVKAVALLADFTGASMQSRKDPDYEYVPDCSDAIFVRAKFKNAFLDGVLFVRADFKLADFSGATVLNCDFSGANLIASKWRKVKRVENCKWKDVIIDDQGNFPRYLWEEIQQQNGKSSKKTQRK
jgi:uncharacterized protein YjbI with pentapeptide repeats